MSQQPFSTAALRGAVDLGALVITEAIKRTDLKWRDLSSR